MCVAYLPVVNEINYSIQILGGTRPQLSYYSFLSFNKLSHINFIARYPINLKSPFFSVGFVCEKLLLPESD